jgi:enoyl-CoA hydratase/carnithine racemase
MALGGEVFPALEALALGIVDRVVETGQALAEAKAWAQKIAERGPLATEAAKLMIAVAEGEESAAATEALASGFIAMTGDLKAGVGAFKAKQKPAFSRS